MPERPTGVTILAILEFIAGALAVAMGVLVAMFVPILALLPFIIGIFCLFIGGLLWTGRGYWVIIVLLIIGLILDIITTIGGFLVAIFGVVVDFIILYYLTRPHVKEFFGK